jgi:hypothetical protein
MIKLELVISIAKVASSCFFHETQRLFELSEICWTGGFFDSFFKYLEPAVLWFWNFLKLKPAVITTHPTLVKTQNQELTSQKSTCDQKNGLVCAIIQVGGRKIKWSSFTCWRKWILLSMLLPTFCRQSWIRIPFPFCV